MLLLVACGNIGILILARLATRSGELAIRTMLGASRARILGQLFVETLLLALVATGVGLLAIDMAVAWLAPRFTLPFWFDPGVTPAFAVKALAVSVLCAVVAGVLPAQRATRGMLQQTIRSAGMGGGTLRLGRVAGALIIIEVGVGTAALFTGGALWLLFEPNPDAHTQVADPDRYLVASIRMPPSARSHSAAGGDDVLRARLASLQEDLGRRLTAQPGVRRWAFSDQPPGEEANERTVRVEGDGRLPDDPGLPGVATFVDPAFFDLLDVSPASGRLFGPGDASLDPAVEPTAAIVNIKFLERRGMSPQSALGARIQFTDGRGPGPGPWKEIIGVVPNIEPSENRVFADGTPVVFLPAMPGTLNPMTLTIDLGSEPLAFASRLRVLVTEADPAVLVEDVYALDHLHGEVNVFAILTSVTAGLALLAILLSTTGLYALMSMTVAQRRREFGIRIALGGSARRVMMAVARRALVQIAVGEALGAGFWLVVISVALTGGEAERTLTQWPFLLAASAAVVTAIALAASLGPTLRYVRMQPSETLRDSTSWHRSCRLRY